MLRPSSQPKPWASSIWFKGEIPKISFNMWVAQLNRLSTRVRIARWSPQQSPLCCFCSSLEETRDHILLACAFCVETWSQVLLKLNRASTFLSRSELMSWIQHASSLVPATLKQLAAHVTVFYGSSETTFFTITPPSLPR